MLVIALTHFNKHACDSLDTLFHNLTLNMVSKK